MFLLALTNCVSAPQDIVEGTQPTQIAQFGACANSAPQQIRGKYFALAAGNLGDAQTCFASWSQDEPEYTCADDFASRLSSQRLIDRALQSCIREGYQNCRAVASHAGLVENGHVARPLTDEWLQKWSVSIRPPMYSIVDSSRNYINQFLGSWAEIDEGGKFSCSAEDATKISIDPDERERVDDYFRMINASNYAIPYGRIVGQSGRRIFLGSLGGSCRDELTLPRREYLIRYEKSLEARMSRPTPGMPSPFRTSRRQSAEDREWDRKYEEKRSLSPIRTIDSLELDDAGQLIVVRDVLGNRQTKKYRRCQ
jgi:hypothetical protein